MKKIISLLLLIAILLLSFTSCSSFDFNWKGNNEQTDGDEDGQDDGNGNPPTPPLEEKDPIESFSPILQTVLKSDYYNEIIRYAKLRMNAKDYSHETSNRYQAIPYGFLEDEGYDIEAIKKDEIKCESDVFVLDGDLYIACRVENKASTTYYTHYVIRYDLTKQELSDLNLTHYRLNSEYSDERKICFQAPLFIQELSLVKNAEKLSEAHITKSGEEGQELCLETKIPNNPYVDMSDFGRDIKVIFLNYWNEKGKTHTYKYVFFNKAQKSSPAIQTKYIATICVSSYGDAISLIDEKQIYIGNGTPDILEPYLNEVANSKRKATFYNSYDSSFIDMLSPDYDQFYGLEK